MNQPPTDARAEAEMPLLTRVVDLFLRGDVALLFILVSLALGAAALYLTPREEEPQIVVPMANVFIQAPGLSAEEVERQVTERLEKLLHQIDGVEYVYSMSQPGQCVVTVRFYVGEDREDSLIKLYDKIYSNSDQLPPVVTEWVAKPIEIDDVPIVIATLWSDRPDQITDFELRRIAEEIQHELQTIPDTNQVRVINGRPRKIRVELDAQRLAARGTSPLQVAEALRVSNVNLRVGRFDQQNQSFVVDAGTFFKDVEQLRKLVIQVSGDRPVYLQDVATLLDGPAEVESYSWIGFGPAAKLESMPGNRASDAQAAADLESNPVTTRPEKSKLAATNSHSFRPGQSVGLFPAVHIAVAKRKGSNAVWVAQQVERRLAEISPELLPTGVHYRITRDYGETANDKVNELVEGLLIAVLTVIGLIGVTIGWRAALVVALAIPVCYSLTLFVNLLAGYTINRVTMFALILALGLLVDDPITDVENIARYFSMRKLPARPSVLQAIQEVRPALILSTLAIIASFLPLVFITGMMGPYMGPMAMNVPLTVTLSTVVAFLVTPWLSMVSLQGMLEGGPDEKPYDVTQGTLYRFSNTFLRPLLRRRQLAWLAMGGVGLLLIGALILPALRLIPLKMLPYDNKNEFQIIIDMPEGTTLDHTDSVARRIGVYLAGVAEVRDFQLYVGTASPMDFNGMVRYYFLRQQPHEADIRVNLAPKDDRQQWSHEIVLRLRDKLDELGRAMGANLKLVEVPPGPPVLATITAEVYGPANRAYGQLISAAGRVKKRMEAEPGIADVDWSTEADQVRWTFVTDKAKAALSGVSTEAIAKTLQVALAGIKATVLHLPDEVDPLWVELRLPRNRRSAISDLEELYVRGNQGQLVQLGGIGKFIQRTEDKTIFHKNLRRVMYVYGEVAGRPPADAIVDMELDRTEEDPRAVSLATATDCDGKASLREELEEPLAESPDETECVARPIAQRTWLSPGGGLPWHLPAGYTVQWAGEGEWKITLDVFRDLGLAFAAALVAIFVILMFQTESYLLPVIIMLAIPLSLIGIMPGFWLLNVLWDKPVGGYPNPIFFTATAMIGMIALSGIVIRNSVVLVDFIHMGQNEGLPLEEAIVRSVAVRMRPILLTAGTTLLGNWVITLDPVFSGLAWAIIFGILTSTVFTLLVIPVVYGMIYGKRS